MAKTILLHVMLAAIAGCAYEPDEDLGFESPIRESPQYALAPNTRWTSLHYYNWSPGGPNLDMRIFLDSHRIQFTRVELGKESPTINHNRIATADEWRWIVGQLKKAGGSRWKQSYEPDGVEVLDGVAWHLEFLDGSNVVGKVFGYNAWPKNFKDFQSILDAFGVARSGSCLVSPKATEEKAALPR